MEPMARPTPVPRTPRKPLPPHLMGLDEKYKALDDAMRTKRAKLEKDLMASYKEDLAYWISDLTETPDLTDVNFWDMLEDGRLLGKVAQEIAKAEVVYQESIGQGSAPRNWKMPKFKDREGIAKGSFFARDNINSFIVFAREFGVPEPALFETSDLVSGTNRKLVLYTLMDVARLSHLELERLPMLIQLEREIDEEEEVEGDGEEDEDLLDTEEIVIVKPPVPRKPSWLLTPKAKLEPEIEPETAEIAPEPHPDPEPALAPEPERDAPTESKQVVVGPASDPEPRWPAEPERDQPLPEPEPEPVPEPEPEPVPEPEPEPALEPEPEPEPEPVTPEPMEEEEEEPVVIKFVKGDEIDQAVQTVTQELGGDVKLKRLRKGKYQLANTKKNLFVRILRNHIVVRVGGGWDTLEHYMLTHRDAHTNLSQALTGAKSIKSTVAATTEQLREHAIKAKQHKANKSAGKGAPPLFERTKKSSMAGQIKFDTASSTPSADIDRPSLPRRKTAPKLLVSPFMVKELGKEPLGGEKKSGLNTHMDSADDVSVINEEEPAIDEDITVPDVGAGHAQPADYVHPMEPDTPICVLTPDIIESEKADSKSSKINMDIENQPVQDSEIISEVEETSGSRQTETSNDEATVLTELKPIDTPHYERDGDHLKSKNTRQEYDNRNSPSKKSAAKHSSMSPQGSSISLRKTRPSLEGNEKGLKLTSKGSSLRSGTKNQSGLSTASKKSEPKASGSRSTRSKVGQSATAKSNPVSVTNKSSSSVRAASSTTRTSNNPAKARTTAGSNADRFKGLYKPREVATAGTKKKTSTRTQGADRFRGLYKDPKKFVARPAPKKATTYVRSPAASSKGKTESEA